MDRIALLREKLVKTRFASCAEHIIDVARGVEPLRAGMNVEVERAAKGRTAPNGQAYHVRIKASTDTIARDQGIIPISAWENGGLRNFNENPVILAFHDHKQPIGRSVYTELDRTDMIQYWEFHEETDISKTMRSLYDRGFMRAASVGFSVRDFLFTDELSEKEYEAYVQKYGATAMRDVYWIAKAAELLETSAVPVPSDPNALTFDFAARNAAAVGIDISSIRRSTPVQTPDTDMLTDEQIAQLARAAEAATATEVAALAASVTALATSVGELRALVETRTAAPVAENTVVEGTPAPVESAAATEGDRAGDTDVEIVKLEGESDNDALNRHIDEVAARLRGAPIPSKK